MNIIQMKLFEIKKPKSNVRIHTQKQLKEYERSVRMFGQIRPIVVDETNTILCGLGLHETLENMGIENADVYKITGLSENQKKKLMIADNKIYGLGIDDLETFNQFLNDLNGDLDVPGFDEDILKSMVADADEVTSTLSSYGTISAEDVTAINNSEERKKELLSDSEKSEEHQEIKSPPNTEATNNTEEIKKSVTCPHCGGAIWL